MLSKELLEKVKSLDDEDKIRLFWILRDDPALAEIAPEVSGLRYNYEAARKLQEMLEEKEAENQPETE